MSVVFGLIMHREEPDSSLRGKSLTIAGVQAIIDRKQAALSWAKRRAGIPTWRALAAAAGQFVPGFFVPFGPEAIDRMILVFLFVLLFLEWLALLDAQFKMMLPAMKPRM